MKIYKRTKANLEHVATQSCFYSAKYFMYSFVKVFVLLLSSFFFSFYHLPFVMLSAYFIAFHILMWDFT